MPSAPSVAKCLYTPKWGCKELFLFVFVFVLAKVRSKELKIFIILRAYELKFGPSLGCRIENFVMFVKFLLQVSKFIRFASIGDLKNLIMLQLVISRMAGEA